MKCDVIRDLLPLYADGVVSEETRKLVETHLESCPACSRELETLKQNLVFPTNQEANQEKTQLLQRFKKTIKKRRVLTALGAAIVAVVLMIGLVAALTLTKIPLPYDEERMSISEENGRLYACYEGDNLTGTIALNVTEVVVKGKRERISLLYFYTTPWDTLWAHMIPKKTSMMPVFKVGEKEGIDAVYYGEFDAETVFTRLPELLQETEIMWEE